MPPILIKNAQVVNEGTIQSRDLLLKDGWIEQIDSSIDYRGAHEINAEGKYLLPGIIDDQVHFRDPGLTHKANIYTEARAAVAGGVTSYMEMPNTIPPAITKERLEQKYDKAANVSLANFSFFMGTSTDNLEEIKKMDPSRVCGLKIFMGSSTGNMLVDDPEVLQKVFEHSPLLIATHCEDEPTIQKNLKKVRDKYEGKIPIQAHPEIRDVKACLRSSRFASKLAKENDARLHILHLTTAEEMELFNNEVPLSDKQITAEVCVHHLNFDHSDYAIHGNWIKCNPAIKPPRHRKALWEALLADKIDVIATDHAPHTRREKKQKYMDAPAGIPLVQHGLNIMLQFYRNGRISLEKIVEKMCHAPAQCFNIQKRGYIREGYWGDLVLVDLDEEWQVNRDNILYKCGWSPLEGHHLTGNVTHTFVNGHLVFKEGEFNEEIHSKRFKFTSH
jgi:dihydroorotase